MFSRFAAENQRCLPQSAHESVVRSLSGPPVRPVKCVCNQLTVTARGTLISGSVSRVCFREFLGFLEDLSSFKHKDDDDLCVCVCVWGRLPSWASKKWATSETGFIDCLCIYSKAGSKIQKYLMICKYRYLSYCLRSKMWFFWSCLVKISAQLNNPHWSRGDAELVSPRGLWSQNLSDKTSSQL